MTATKQQVSEWRGLGSWLRDLIPVKRRTTRRVVHFEALESAVPFDFDHSLAALKESGPKGKQLAAKLERKCPHG